MEYRQVIIAHMKVSHHHEHVGNLSSCDTDSICNCEFAIHATVFKYTYDMCTIDDEHLSV